jgi:hypothetical protein
VRRAITYVGAAAVSSALATFAVLALFQSTSDPAIHLVPTNRASVSETTEVTSAVDTPETAVTALSDASSALPVASVPVERRVSDLEVRVGNIEATTTTEQPAYVPVSAPTTTEQPTTTTSAEPATTVPAPHPVTTEGVANG